MLVRIIYYVTYVCYTNCKRELPVQPGYDRASENAHMRPKFATLTLKCLKSAISVGSPHASFLLSELANCNF